MLLKMLLRMILLSLVLFLLHFPPQRKLAVSSFSSGNFILSMLGWHTIIIFGLLPQRLLCELCVAN